ncbi:MAG: pyridoxine 5'-phosphate synthase [Candidatus Stahlbacteria bacterium]|nr:pyridoxine 5'-phosphate synthase [Candidatus Stahlbacteria bacterium]
MRLGVNIDHIATIREARGIDLPDPVQAAAIVELTGAYGITVHLRKDRRHIKERDVELLKRTLKTHLNVEISLDSEILEFIKSIQPDACCLVPERVEEITTEGGLNIIKFIQPTKNTVQELKAMGIKTTAFIEPDEELIKTAPKCEVDAIEINTSKYADAKTIKDRQNELVRIKNAAQIAHSFGLEVHAGHGLNWYNVQPIAKIQEIVELNIGHSIIARAIFVGLERAVKEILDLL